MSTKNLARRTIEGGRYWGATWTCRQQHILETPDAALWRALPDWFRACHDPFVAPTRYSKPLI